MRTETVTRPRRRSKLSPAEMAELSQHPFARIPGTTKDAYGDTVLDVKPTTDAIEAMDQGALLGLRMLDAVLECQRSGSFKAVPSQLVRLLCREAEGQAGSSPESWRLLGFMRVLEMVLNGYVQHRHHGQDAPHVIGLQRAWMQWSGRVLS